MIHIKQFLDKMSVMEVRQNKDVVLPITDARGLRDDITRLLADLHTMSSNQADTKNEIVQLEIKGGSFK